MIKQLSLFDDYTPELMDKEIAKLPPIPYVADTLLISENALCLDHIVIAANKIQGNLGWTGHSCGYYVLHYLKGVELYRTLEACKTTEIQKCVYF